MSLVILFVATQVVGLNVDDFEEVGRRILAVCVSKLLFYYYVRALHLAWSDLFMRGKR